jgi:hypothetical protein
MSNALPSLNLKGLCYNYLYICITASSVEFTFYLLHLQLSCISFLFEITCTVLGLKTLFTLCKIYTGVLFCVDPSRRGNVSILCFIDSI